MPTVPGFGANVVTIVIILVLAITRSTASRVPRVDSLTFDLFGC